jgi:geranylgeranyl transferase type-2 subunit alpha
VVLPQIVDKEYNPEVLGLTTKLLNENPEYYTIWNYRRRLLQALLDDSSPESDPTPVQPQQHAKEYVQSELNLTFALLRKFPKCYWIWNHRNWILAESELKLTSEDARKLWLGELQLVGKMLNTDSRNFHAWSYRRIVVEQLRRMQPSVTNEGTGIAETRSLTETEFEFTTKMIKSNLSNFSAGHYRSKLIPGLLNERRADNNSRRELFDGELAWICEAINTDPYDQSIWYYHQYLMSTLSPHCPQQSLIILDITNNDRQKYYAHEIEYIRDIIEDEPDCKWIYESLLFLSGLYLEVESGTKTFTTLDMRSWLEQLNRLDPLRKGRWKELGVSLNI